MGIKSIKTKQREILIWHNELKQYENEIQLDKDKSIEEAKPSCSNGYKYMAS